MKTPGRKAQNGPPRWRRVLFRAGLGVGILLFAWQVWSAYRAVSRQGSLNLRLDWLLAGLVLSLLFYAIQVLGWIAIMRHLGIVIKPRHAIKGYFLSFLPRYIPGSVWGYLSRSQWLKQSHGVEYATSALGSILESAALVSTAFVIAGVYLFTESSGVARALFASSIAGVLLLTWLMLPRLALQIRKKFAGEKELDCTGHRLTSKSWTAAVVLYLALWVSYSASVLCTSQAVMPGSLKNPLASGFVSSLSWILGFAAIIVPAGIGVRELSISALLSTHGGLPSWQADLVALILRVEVLMAEFCYVALSLAMRLPQWRNTLFQRTQPSAGLQRQQGLPSDED